MAERSDITVDWGISPRLAEVALPSTELATQDAHDTFNSNTLQPGMADASLENIDDEPIIASAGKEDLGGGTSVGITATLLDMQIAFERTASRSSGAVTTADSAGELLIDNLADFVTEGVQRGDWVINFTDQSVCEVLSVVDLNTLRTRALSDGTDNQFDIADVYKVWEVSECNLVGGNYVAEDDAGDPINPLFTTFGRFATRTSSSSATSTSQALLEHGTFNGGIYWDAIGGKSSIIEDTDGNEAEPLLNLDDVLTQAVDQLYGEGPTQTLITFEAGCSTVKTTINDAEIEGDVEGALEVTNCHISPFTDVGSAVTETVFKDCVLKPDATNTIKLATTATQTIHIINARSGSPGDTPITIDANGASAGIRMSGYDGGVLFKNITNPLQDISIGTTGGHVALDPTCTDVGSFVYRGDTKMTNLSTIVPIDQSSSALVWEQDSGSFLVKIVKNLKEIIKISGVWYLIIYDDGEVSGGTEILRKALKDSTGANITDLAAGTLAAELESSV